MLNVVRILYRRLELLRNYYVLQEGTHLDNNMVYTKMNIANTEFQKGNTFKKYRLFKSIVDETFLSRGVSKSQR